MGILDFLVLYQFIWVKNVITCEREGQAVSIQRTRLKQQRWCDEFNLLKYLMWDTCRTYCFKLWCIRIKKMTLIKHKHMLLPSREKKMNKKINKYQTQYYEMQKLVKICNVMANMQLPWYTIISTHTIQWTLKV